MNPKTRPSATGPGFRLAGFPKEFERNLWESLDKRYYTILLVTFVFMYSLVFFLASRDWSLSEEDISKLKQKVFEMVYEAEIIAPIETLEEVPLLETAEGGGEEEVGEEGQQRAAESTTEKLERQRRGRASRAEQARKMAQDVAGSGILAIATAAGGVGTGGVAYDDVLRDIAGGAGGISDVGSVVAGTAGIAAASSSGDRTRVAKGGGYRGSGEGIGIDDLIEGQGVAGSSSFKRRGGVELGGGVDLSGPGAGAGARDAQGILGVLNQNKTSVEYCYQKFLKINPAISGEIYLELTITPEGRVSSVRILNSTLGDRKLESCITRTIKRWRGFGKIDPSLGDVRTRFKYIF